MPFPGRNAFFNGYIEDDADADLKLLNSPEMTKALVTLGLEFIEIAKGVFEATSIHDPNDILKQYNESWELKEVHDFLVQGIQIWNMDFTAEWVEFGAHAGGKTRVLRYRIMGRTADILEGREL